MVQNFLSTSSVNFCCYTTFNVQNVGILEVDGAGRILRLIFNKKSVFVAVAFVKLLCVMSRSIFCAYSVILFAIH